ncbi:unnamed protein product [Parascedosporium putredinis]|uniref:Glycosyl hydrolase family 30 beta sandwich domain-containing protein n=1 Tax=Parascedosporium putredinis TaxID=1442378 RepID=A0A9P1GVL8_9PEZI|nr:unnamed protein product [Parascedosporium putredinis]CAI7988608.1 unnamed protein product [Parascedosporium putredinis]
MNHNAGGYLYWEGVQWPNPNTNEKIIRVDQQTGDYEVATRLWAFANWSRFVRPNAVRVGTSGGSGARIAAFKNEDGSVAVVLISQGGGGDVTVKISGEGAPAGKATAWASDDQRKCAEVEVTVGADGAVTANVGQSSITTIHIAAAEPEAEPEPAPEPEAPVEEETPAVPVEP